MLIESSNSDAKLEISHLKGERFTVSINSITHSASMHISTDSHLYGLVRLFRDAASDWRGWSGEKYWESLEGDFRLGLISDSLGHVRLKVMMLSDSGNPDPWRLTAELGIEAGQLESIAHDIELVLSKNPGLASLIEQGRVLSK